MGLAGASGDSSDVARSRHTLVMVTSPAGYNMAETLL